jgi:hypothetical protein
MQLAKDPPYLRIIRYLPTFTPLPATCAAPGVQPAAAHAGSATRLGDDKA